MAQIGGCGNAGSFCVRFDNRASSSERVPAILSLHFQRGRQCKSHKPFPTDLWYSKVINFNIDSDISTPQSVHFNLQEASLQVKMF